MEFLDIYNKLCYDKIFVIKYENFNQIDLFLENLLSNLEGYQRRVMLFSNCGDYPFEKENFKVLNSFLSDFGWEKSRDWAFKLRVMQTVFISDDIIDESIFACLQNHVYSGDPVFLFYKDNDNHLNPLLEDQFFFDISDS